MTPIVEAKNLKKTFGAFTAVEDVSFHIVKGECFGLLGPNGAGKTTTIRMLYGYTPLTSGALKLFGEDLEPNLRKLKYRIGVCQQENNLDPDLTVLENLQVFARYFDIPKSEARTRIDRLLEFFALNNRSKALFTDLSGGMRRRLVLARSLINNPDLLILDEPTSALDPQTRQQVWSRLLELKKEGLTILLTTHYMEEAYRLCDRLLIMDQGKVLVEGKPGELIDRYVGREVLEIDSPDQKLRDFLISQGYMFDDLGTRLMIYNHNCRELFDAIEKVFDHKNCMLRMGTLEDVFLKLTGRDLRE
ncbi:MAG: ATP-binding cassette domain-containing protein [Deltaproteobacteria bacterium]|nr:ATP-binding cassette domain-containing protein [Deltaproteobacteria bacterium]